MRHLLRFLLFCILLIPTYTVIGSALGAGKAHLPGDGQSVEGALQSVSYQALVDLDRPAIGNYGIYLPLVSVQHAGRIAPNPILSRGKPTFSPMGSVPGLVDGLYGDHAAWPVGYPTPQDPTWVAIKIGGGYSRVLLTWSSTFNYDYNATSYGVPSSYLVQTSADSTNGADGTWTTVVSVTGNYVRTREHSLDFTGRSWVRMLITGLSPNTSVGSAIIDEIEVYDLSMGGQDTWFFMGDSITAEAFDRRTIHQPSFASWVYTLNSSYFPAMVDGGIGFETAASGLSHIDAWLQMNPDMHFWALGYGTNDSQGNLSDPTSFRANMQALIDKIKAAGHVPVLAKIPYATDGDHNYIPAFNRAIDELTAANGLKPGPDLYAWFRANPQELRADGLHPNDIGAQSINRLWAEAMSDLYR